MKIVTIRKNNVITNQGHFETEKEALEWLKNESANLSFGLPERPELDERGKPTGKTLPAEFVSSLEDFSLPVEEKRKADYQKEIDPSFQEAVMDYIAGKPGKMTKLQADYEKIKVRHPKMEDEKIHASIPKKKAKTATRRSK